MPAFATPKTQWPASCRSCATARTSNC
jgi:hypothetical protein